MEKRTVDVAIIGTGTSGMGAYREAAKTTDSIALIEGNKYGTTCARVGCMPSKLLIAAAEAAHNVEKAPQFGVNAQINDIDGRKVMERVKSERDRFVGFVLESVDGFNPDHLIKGYAKFVNDNTLIIDNKIEIKAKTIVIATGSSPAIPPIFQKVTDRLIINDDVFDWDDLPESVALFGPGVIGLELGQALHRLGVKIKIFGRGGFVGPLSDPEILEYATDAFQGEFYLNPDADVTSIVQKDDKVNITYKHFDGNSITEGFDYVLATTGRTPNVRNLGLENTTLPLDDRGVPLFNQYTMQIGDHPVFIAGDANNDKPLLHEAADEGKIAGKNAAQFPKISAGKRTSPIGVVFSDPQLATVGSSFASLTEGCFETGTVSFEGQGRSRTMLVNKGLMNVYGELGTGLLLGAEIFGPRAEHLAHLLAWCHQQKMTIPEILEMPFYHPVIEEGLRTALRDLNSKLQLGPIPVKRCLDCGPGA
ncbi:dihydrolipoyl dehydrogenase [Pseudemcibacter aquimaris]|uniref:dihydrolipoyl dehydrogenase n=1 Tax=Pseudemcibacter aquimaris TaxID=2857064 RepID=UPI002012A230|nr:dihydrolipoyl dehydrogenase [Pseudemcibacter aquimaris]MCC3860751.1 dihydrolipoyl dehydrogenase [Pseudemcibacter aquimaris]WDU59569.1 dihydrolipoyl dehydrogenase [Pseudemcibacter aquimaris]